MQALGNKHCFCTDAFTTGTGHRSAASRRRGTRSNAGPARSSNSRADNRGNLRLYLDSASVYQWEKFAPRGFLYGITCNPLILQRDQVPQCNLKVYKILAKQAFDLGFQEIQLQAWGRDQREIESVGSEIAAISDRVVVKIPVTAEGTAAAASLKRQKAPVTLTALYSSHQVLAALGIGADYVAPYLSRISDSGRDGFKEVLEMNDIAKGTDSSLRILVASIRKASDVTTLAAQGCDTFTIPPQTADELFSDPQTESAAHEFERAVQSLGGYS